MMNVPHQIKHSRKMFSGNGHDFSRIKITAQNDNERSSNRKRFLHSNFTYQRETTSKSSYLNVPGLDWVRRPDLYSQSISKICLQV